MYCRGLRNYVICSQHVALLLIDDDARPYSLALALEFFWDVQELAEYRVTGQQHFWVTTPVVGPFVAARVPIVGRFRGLLVGGFDYFARRTELASGFDTLYSTPAVAPYIGVVLEAGLTL